MSISVQVARLGSTTAKFVITAFTAALLAGCSDSIERFSSNYNNPSDVDPVYTASVPKYKKPVTTQYARPKALASNEEVILQSPVASAPLVKAGSPSYDYTNAYKKPRLALAKQPDAPAYKSPAYKQPVLQSADAADESVLPEATAPTFKKAAFTSGNASSTIRVGQGMTMYSIAKANHMSVQQLAKMNGIAAPYTVSTGRVLRLPAGASVAQAPEVVASKYKKEAARAVGNHTVASGDTLFSLGRQYGISPFAIADLNKLPHSKALSVGQKLRIPGDSNAPKLASKEKPNVAQDDSADNSSDVVPTQKVAAASLALPKGNSSEQPIAATAADGTTLSMRWPVKGKVISEFGAKPNGLKNEGINIAVPEGTSIRAAEGGVVAYAGNELKGYGNLILVRHAGGFVTAYAHASQLMVKRGDTVKRGDIIAKAGQTGAVQSPQLHFEVRKGASALDPYKYLTSSTAMN